MFGGATIKYTDGVLPLLCLVGQDYCPLPTMAKHQIVRPSEIILVGSLLPRVLSHQFECETFVTMNPSLHRPEFYGVLWPFHNETDIDLWNSVWGQELVLCEFQFPYVSIHQIGKSCLACLLPLSPWAYRLKRKLTQSVRKRVQKNKQKNKALARKYVDKQGCKRVCQTYWICIGFKISTPSMLCAGFPPSKVDNTNL